MANHVLETEKGSHNKVPIKEKIMSILWVYEKLAKTRENHRRHLNLIKQQFIQFVLFFFILLNIDM